MLHPLVALRTMCEGMMWRQTSEAKYNEMLGILPPAYMDGYGFLVGEPMDHNFCAVSGVVMPRYSAYVKKGKRYYASVSPMTYAEYRKYVPQLIAKGRKP
jgi:uncharacterized short protein YbdD (DUF466 family)